MGDPVQAIFSTKNIFNKKNEVIVMYKLTNIILIIIILVLIGCNPSVKVPFPDHLKLYNPKNLPDLRARTVTITVNHTQKTCCVAAILQNNGDVDISGPFIVAIGITVRQPNGVLISSEKKVQIPSSVTIPAFGGEYTTECSQSRLFYCDEVGSLPNHGGLRAYWLEVIVDLEHQVQEINESNNYFETLWCTTP